ncbi:MAG: hypothetical protein ACR2LX_06105 [Jatrophihabitans sp.]
MRMSRKSTSKKSGGPGWESKSQAALAGSDGDGKDHDLQYWLDSGFLTLPRKDSHNPPEGAPA